MAVDCNNTNKKYNNLFMKPIQIQLVRKILKRSQSCPNASLEMTRCAKLWLFNVYLRAICKLLAFNAIKKNTCCVILLGQGITTAGISMKVPSMSYIQTSSDMCGTGMSTLRSCSRHYSMI